MNLRLSDLKKISWGLLTYLNQLRGYKMYEEILYLYIGVAIIFLIVRVYFWIKNKRKPKKKNDHNTYIRFK